MWLSEVPWITLINLAMLALAFGIAWYRKKRKVYLATAIGLAVLALVILGASTVWFVKWFTEDPWPAVMILAVLGLVFGIAWYSTRRGVHFLLAIGMVVLGLVVLLAEQMIVTEAEDVEARVLELGDAVVEGNPETVMGFFGAGTESLQSTINTNLKIVDVREGLRITDLEVTLEPGASEAESHFRANGEVLVRKSMTYTSATRWNLTWKKEDGTWKITEIQRLEPIKGEVIDTWGGL